MISFTCPHCHTQIQMDERYAGQAGKCNSCANIITVPTPNAFTPQDPAALQNLHIDVDKQPPPPVYIPQTKEKQSLPTGKIVLIGCGITLGGIMLLSLATCFSVVTTISTDPEFQDAMRELQEVAPNDSNIIITLSEFNQLRTGMTYQQAVQIIGDGGEVLSENEMMTGTEYATHTIMYQWQNSDWSGANAMFQNGKLIQKSQIALQ